MSRSAFVSCTCCLFLSRACLAADAPAPQPSISQAGTGTASAPPDRGRIRVGVASVKADARAALAANAEAMDAVRKAVGALGVDLNRDVQTVRYDISDHYATTGERGHESRHKDGYVVTHTVSVIVRTLADLGKVIDAMVAAGANDVDSVSFDSSESALKKDAARAEAVKDAARRAGLIASGLGYRLGPVIEASEAGDNDPMFRPVMGYLSPTSAESAPTEISGGSLEYHARVFVKWALVKDAPAP